MQTDFSLSITTGLQNLAKLRRFVKRTAAALEVDPEAIGEIQLAVDEAATNIILHGYQGQPGQIEVEIRRIGADITICLRDSAPPFDPITVPQPNLTLPLHKRSPGGMGVHLMRQVMDEIHHRVTANGGNELTLIKRGVSSASTE